MKSRMLLILLLFLGIQAPLSCVFADDRSQDSAESVSEKEHVEDSSGKREELLFAGSNIRTTRLADGSIYVSGAVDDISQCIDLINAISSKVWLDILLINQESIEVFREIATKLKFHKLTLRTRTLNSQMVSALVENSNLEELFFHGETIEPGSLKDLPSLKKLTSLTVWQENVDNKDISQIGQCLNLEKLNLGQMNISSRILERLQHLNSLKELVFDHATFPANERIGLGYLEGVRHVSFIDSDNPNPMIHEASQLNSVESLTVEGRSSGKSLSRESLLSLLEMQNLVALDLIDVGVTNAGVEILSQISSLKKLSLDWNSDITPMSFKYLSKLRNLESLSLKDIASGGGLNQLSQLTQLSTLQLSLTDITDKDLKALSKFPRLKSLDLSRTKITDDGLAHLLSLKELEELTLVRTDISKQGLDTISKIATIQKLNISFTKISNDSMKPVSELDNLRWLSIASTEIKPGGLNPLLHCTKLEHISLSYNDVSDEDACVIAKLPNLQSIYIVNTKITDRSIPCFVSMPKLQTLDIEGTDVSDQYNNA